MFENYSDVLEVKELCEMLNIGKNTAYNLIKSKKLKVIRIGKTIKIPKVWLIEYINQTA